MGGNVLEVAAATHVGRVRQQNEDALAFDASLGYVVLADGLGGCPAGEVASRTAVEAASATLRDALRRTSFESIPRDLVVRAINAANDAVFESARTHPARAGMATTLVVAVWHDSALMVGHVGDSRMYRFRGGLVQLTHDHSIAQERLDRGLAGSGAQHAAARALVTRVVGARPFAGADVRSEPAFASDTYLVCSDGLSDLVPGNEIETLLETGATLDDIAEALVAAANLNGGRDNISLILARVPAAESSR